MMAIKAMGIKRTMPNKRKKIPTSHRHFRYQPLTLTWNEFKLRLATRLSEDVLETELMVKFPSLYAFREEYIIPLTRKFHTRFVMPRGRRRHVSQRVRKFIRIYFRKRLSCSSNTESSWEKRQFRKRNNG